MTISKQKKKNKTRLSGYTDSENRHDHISGSVSWSSGITQHSTSPAKR
jgi:hypothetical protein